MTESASQYFLNEQKPLGAGTKRSPQNRRSFSVAMATTSLMADDSDPTNAISFAENSSSTRNFFKRKFSFGSTD